MLAWVCSLLRQGGGEGPVVVHLPSIARVHVFWCKEMAALAGGHEDVARRLRALSDSAVETCR